MKFLKITRWSVTISNEEYFNSIDRSRVNTLTQRNNNLTLSKRGGRGRKNSHKFAACARSSREAIFFRLPVREPRRKKGNVEIYFARDLDKATIKRRSFFFFVFSSCSSSSLPLSSFLSSFFPFFFLPFFFPRKVIGNPATEGTNEN